MPHGGDTIPLDLSRIAQDLQIRKVQVESVVLLLDEGNTIPFITRYRKERTGGLDEEVLRIIQERVGQLRQLADRKQTILKSIDNQGKLTPELRAAILGADNPKRLEDLYLPYKPKKRTLATAAREKGLEPLALALWNRDPALGNLAELLPTLVNPEKELNTPEDVLLGAQHILAELVAEAAEVRAIVRAVLWDTGRLMTTKSEKLAEGQGLDYKDYFQFQEPVRHIPPHRILAINRGEKENALSVKLDWDAETGQRVALERLPLPLEYVPPAPEASPAPAAEANGTPVDGTAPGDGTPHGAAAPDGENPVHHAEVAPAHGGRGPAHREPPHGWEALQTHPHADFIRTVTADALSRLLVPSLEREIRRELTFRAEGHAVSVFARNLRSKLLAAPLRDKRVLAIDPGFRTGCKVAALDETGNLLEDGVIFPHPPQNKRAEAKAKLEEMIRRYQLSVIAIGNGTACRETEEVVSEVIAALDARRQGGGEPAAPPTAEPAEQAQEAPPTPPAVEVPPPAPAPVEASAPPEGTPVEDTPALVVEGAPVAEGTPVVEDTPAPTAEAVPAEPAAPPAPPGPPLPDAPADLAYVIVNEAGASVYSASPVGREEFPNFDATTRGTISIGRRLQDPLSELVKIDPQHVGVGLYQHDVNPKHLRESLEGVIESCVNAVGVDLNTASVPLLRHVSGLNQLVARELIEYRKKSGGFHSREQLREVPGIGEARWVQAAGFLKIESGVDPLDRTWIHPESYPLARQILTDLGFEPTILLDREAGLEALREKLREASTEEIANRLHAGMPTVQDILESLARPGRDPREDLPPPIFKKGILQLEDLQPGMELKGTVLNVVDFGAFIDIGLKDSGLVHISQMANRYVKIPYDIVAVGDVVSVWVLAVDKERRRVSLTMIRPGTERKQPERRPQGPARREGPPREGPPREGGGREGGPPREGQARREGPPRENQGRREGPPRGGPPRGGPVGRALPPRGQTRQGMAQGRRPGQPTQQGQQHQGGGGQPAQQEAPQPAQQEAPQRKTKKQQARPNLSQAALAGAAPLGTFAELAAFWEAKKKEDTDAPAAAEQGGQTPPPAAGGETPQA
jgi:uncharacterized protein